MASARPRCGRSASPLGNFAHAKTFPPAAYRYQRKAGAVVHHGSREETVKMRIAQVAPLTEAVPPRLYGGTERVVHWLTEELVVLGNDVTLFASGDSRTSAKLD